MWLYRERLNYYEKVRRSLYEITRDTLESRLMKISLIDSFYNYMKNNAEYNFVDKRELRPRAKRMEKDSKLFKTFIVIFCERSINPELKNYIRFFPENSAIKENLRLLADFSLYKKFHRNLRYFDHPVFLDLVSELLDIDYALLIQQDPTIKKKNRYALTHFHVKIDWPIADAAEDLAKWLRYIQNNLHENGDKEARILQNKLFEYYGWHYSVGGRRTAALIAAQLLKKLDLMSTIFVSSAESRSMVKYSERGVSKYFLIRLTNKQIMALADRERMNTELFKESFLYPAMDYYVGILEAVYDHTIHSKPPEDGKIRKVNPAYSWLRLTDELLHPKLDSIQLRPINYNWVYTSN
ncbi:MAG: hypothetical protein A2Z39_02620 [Deltaproteobacteria bacterium RBG_19FT_COMBO_46_9]|nr:MAG: hypothetical protein A2Z39_02620 [Deltaproteobacteria bacterium RBG_19FT_COMBO_46_9]